MPLNIATLRIYVPSSGAGVARSFEMVDQAAIASARLAEQCAGGEMGQKRLHCRSRGRIIVARDPLEIRTLPHYAATFPAIGR